MEKKAISSTLFMVLLITTMTLAFNIQRAKATVASGDIVVTTYSNTRLLKLDRDGNIVWNIDMGSKTMEAYWNLIDGTIYLVSVSPNRLTKLDSNGNILWDKDLSFMSGGTTNLDVDPNDGSVYVCAGEGAPQAGVYKYDSSGNQLWHQQVNFQSVAVNPIDGSVYANSWIEGVYKYDSNGNFLWNTYIGGYQTSYGHYSIAVDPSDGSVVATTRWGGPVVKLDPDGNIVWQTFTTKDLGGVAVDSDRNAVYVTASNWPSGIGPFNLYKLNLTNGNIEWERPVSEAPGGSPSPQLGVDHFDGSIYTGEYSESSDFSGTLYKREPDNGNIVWSKTLGYSTWGISIEPQKPTLTITLTNKGSGKTETITLELVDEDHDGFITLDIENRIVSAVRRTHDTATFDFPGEYTETQGAWTVTLSCTNDYTVTLT